MFGIGWTELVFVLLMLLIFVGPRHLPGMLRRAGQLMAELRSASRELRNQIDIEARDIESPVSLARKVGRDLIKELPSPYEEAEPGDEGASEVEREETRGGSSGDEPESRDAEEDER